MHDPCEEAPSEKQHVVAVASGTVQEEVVPDGTWTGSLDLANRSCETEIASLQELHSDHHCWAAAHDQYTGLELLLVLVPADTR